MNKFVLLSLFAIAVTADISDFPAFDFSHANCAMQVTYPGKQCTEIFATMKNVLTQYEGGDPGKGIYAFKESKDETYFWMTRTTPVHKYVDDIAFEFAQACDGCTI